MSFISRGFQRRQAPAAPSDRLPPGQYVTRDFPVLSAGPTPRTPLDAWGLDIVGEIDQPRAWTWLELMALPAEDVTVDIHCVTKWSKLDTAWRGVSLDTLLDGVETAAGYVLAHSLRRLHHEPAARRPARRPGLGRLRVRRRAARARARRSGPAAGAAPLLLEERQVGPRARAAADRRARASGSATATTTTATRGASSATPATDLGQSREVVDRIDETPRVAASSSTSPTGPDTCPASTSTSGSPPRTATRPSAATRSPRRRRAARDDHRRAARRRRGLAVPHRRAACSATGSSCADRSAATSCGSRAAAVRCAGRRRLGRRAAHGDAARTGRAGSACRSALLCSWRIRDDIIYRDELAGWRRDAGASRSSHTLTRSAPPGWTGLRGRIDRDVAGRGRLAAGAPAATYVCGPTAFVEAVARAWSSWAMPPHAS